MNDGSNKPMNQNHQSTKSEDSTQDEGRISHRIPIQLLVDYNSKGNYLFDFCRDLGAGGVFIETQNPLPKDSKINLTFTIPDSKETVSAKGIVIWSQPTVTGRPDATPGMGIQFTEFSTKHREIMDRFVERYRKSTKEGSAA